MKTKKYSYYNIDLGFFPRCVKLCFTDDQFQDALRDQKIPSNGIKALDYGLAETHLISDGQKQVIIVVFNLKELSNGLDELVGAIAHETVHVIDRISEYIGDESEFSSETRAYLTEPIVKQIFKACVIEKENHARKTYRKLFQAGDQESGRTDVQMDKHSDGGARQNSNPEKTIVLYRGEDADGCVIGAPKTGLFGATTTRVPSTDYPEQK